MPTYNYILKSRSHRRHASTTINTVVHDLDTSRSRRRERLRLQSTYMVEMSSAGCYRHDSRGDRKAMKALGQWLAPVLGKRDWAGLINLVWASTAHIPTAEFYGTHSPAMGILWGSPEDMICSLLPESVRNSFNYWENMICSEWEAPRWHLEPWFRHSPYRWLHMLHVSEEDPGSVCYAENDAKREKGIYTRTKPGRYLTKFFHDKLTEKDIKYWADRQAAGNISVVLKFIEHDDPDGWVRVYGDNTVYSCMQGMDCVKIYAHDKSVLRLAYLEDSDGKIQGRCIVREDTKQYIRCYPVRSSDEQPDGQWHKWQTRMQQAVSSAGYKVLGNLKEVLLQYIEARHIRGRVVCPYLDCGVGDAQGVSKVTQNGVAYLQVGVHGGSGSGTEGWTSLRDRDVSYCSHCQDECDEDYLTNIDDGSYCESCRDDNFTYAMGRRNEEYFANEDVIHCQSDDRYYYEETTSYHDVYECQVTGDWYHEDDMVVTRLGWVRNEEATHLDIPDDNGHDYAINNDIITTEDGEIINVRDAKDCSVSLCTYHRGTLWRIDNGDGKYLFIHPDSLLDREHWGDLWVQRVGVEWMLLTQVEEPHEDIYPMACLPSDFIEIVSDGLGFEFKNVRIGEHAVYAGDVVIKLVSLVRQLMLEFQAAA